jgi:CHAT domain-containing protein/Tfp pilus assembly protein PilF
MRKSILLIAFICLNNLLNAQDVYNNYKSTYDQFRKEEKYDSALVIAKQINAWALQNETDTSLKYAVSLRYLGNCFNSLKQSDSALFFYKKSINVLELQNRTSSPDYSGCYYNIGLVFYDKGDFKNALVYTKEALKLRKQFLGGNDLDYARSLNNTCLILEDIGYIKEAEEYYKEAIEIFKIQLGSDNLDYATILYNYANFQSGQGNLKLAESTLELVLEIRKKNIDSDYAMTLQSIGVNQFNSGKYAAADSSISLAARILEKNYGIKSVEYATCMSNLGLLYMEKGLYAKSIDYINKSLIIRQEIQGKDHPDYLSTLNKLGIVYKNQGEFRSADSIFQFVLVSRCELLGENSPDYIATLNNLGNLYSEIGDYKQAAYYLKKSFQLGENTLGKNSSDYASLLNNIGVLYLDMSDYKISETYFKKALDINMKKFGDDNLSCADNYNNLGILFSELGDYYSAEYYYKKALEIRSYFLGTKHIQYAKSLENLGILYSELNDLDKAIDFVSKSLEIRKEILGNSHPGYFLSLINMGAIYYEKGDFNNAERNFKLVEEYYDENINKNFKCYSSTLINMVLIMYKRNEYYLSENYYVKALEYLGNVLDEPSPKLFTLSNSYAYLQLRTNREQGAYSILNNNFSKKVKIIADNFEWLNDNQKEAYWKKESSFYDNLSWFANQAFEAVPEAVGLNYNAALLTKSKMLEAKISSENYYREVDELREELAYRRRLLAKMESDGSNEKEKLKKLHHEADSLDKRLTLSWPEYAQQKKNLTITWDQVQQNLDKGEAAIEFVRFENEDDSLVYYNALVLKKGDQNPTMVKLCKEIDLQSITPKMGYSAYYPLIWQPLEAVLKDITTIYYAPTGELYNVPFHAIYAPKDGGDEIIAAKTDKRGVVIEQEHATTEADAEYLMDRYTLHQLTSTRYLAMGLKQKAIEPIGNTMAMVGGVNYDYLPGSIDASKKNKKDKNASRSSASASGKLNYLEGTKIEVEQINQQVTTATWQTKLIENNEAIEENITKLEGKEANGILHLATHGYAFPEYDFKDTSISKNSLRYSYRYSTNPMVRSGIILAGGNWAWTGSDTLSKLGAEQNGILTALEVSQLNLKKTKLVVLSACETGLGKIEGSEGTFGLKRGFKLAGVEQMIVSLWSVPDKETMELMTLFYSDLTKTLNPVLSFEKAQKELRIKYPTEPEKWAGFVLVR